MGSLFSELEQRGVVHQVTDEALRARLDAPPLTFYTGFDPSSSSLHVGSLLQLVTMARLQRAGHRPIALLGGGTGLIGDPGGKTTERALRGREEIEANVEGIRAQIERFVEGALVLDNAAWLCTLGAVELLRDVGKHFTVNQMVAKESVKQRLARPDQGISYTEFSYMLLQAYDFYRLHEDHGCELQLGGSDQWGNITMGVELISKRSGAHAYGLTTPLVVKADGTKFGKTEAGTVWLDAARTSPYRLYQFMLQTEDTVVGTYLRYFTTLDLAAVASLEEETAQHPERRSAQRKLAREVCVMVHGKEEADRAEQASRALFGEEIAALDEPTLLDIVADVPSSTLPRATLGEVTLVDALVTSGLLSSRGAARRALAQGGVYVNNRRVDDDARRLERSDLLHDRYVVLRRGRRDYHVLVAR